MTEVNCFFKPNCDIQRVTSAAVLVCDNVKNYQSRPDKEINYNFDPVHVKTQVINVCGGSSCCLIC